MATNEIGRRLYQRRVSLGLTQKKVAEFVGVTEATVSRWESGEIDNMRRDKIARVAKILKTSPLFVMGLIEDPSKQDFGVSFSEDESKLLSGYRSLDIKGKSAIWSVLSALGGSGTRTIART